MNAIKNGVCDISRDACRLNTFIKWKMSNKIALITNLYDKFEVAVIWGLSRVSLMDKYFFILNASYAKSYSQRNWPCLQKISSSGIFNLSSKNTSPAVIE